MSLTAEHIANASQNKKLKKLLKHAELALEHGIDSLDLLDQKHIAQPGMIEHIQAKKALGSLTVQLAADAALASAGFDNARISALMSQHTSAVVGERAAFKSYRWLDELISATAFNPLHHQRLTNAEKVQFEQSLLEQRRRELHGIHKAMLSATLRHEELLELLEPLKNNPNTADQYKKGMVFADQMMDHIPKMWRGEIDTLDRRIDDLCRSTGEKNQEKAKALSILDPDSEAERQLEVEHIRNAIEYGSLKKLERTIPYYDPPARAIPPEIQKQFDRTIELVTERAHRIRDNGGTIQEIEASMGHIPPQFWPEDFVRDLQAWRKVERELAAERVEKLNQDDRLNSDDFKDLLGFALDAIGFVAISTDFDGSMNETGANAGKAAIPCAWRNAPGFMEASAGLMAAVNDGWGWGAEVRDAVKNHNPDAAYEAMVAKDSALQTQPKEKVLALLQARIAEQNQTTAKAMAVVATAANKSQQAISFASNVGWTAAAIEGIQNSDEQIEVLKTQCSATYFSAEVIPVLCAVGAGINLAQCLASLGKSIQMRVKTGALLEEAELEHAAGKSTDGGALVHAICNERAARNRQIAKKSTEVTSASLTFAGEMVLATGAGAPVGLGLKVAGKSVEYAGKVVFASINWGIAKNAKALIKKAKAGDPVARMEVFSKSGLYAKTYLAIMAREGHPIAQKFLVDRGINEADMNNPAIAISVLRDIMLNHADQKNEEEVPEKWRTAVAEEIAGAGTVKMINGRKKRATAKVMAKAAAEKPYDENARKFTAADANVHFSIDAPKEWKSLFERAENQFEANAAYFKASNTVGKNLEKCASGLKKLDGLIGQSFAALLNAKKIPKDKVTKGIQSVSEQLQLTILIVNAQNPLSNSKEQHAAMLAVLAQLVGTLTEKQAEINQYFFTLKIKNPDWNPPEAAQLSSASWKTNWTDAMEKCKVPSSKVMYKKLKELESLIQSNQMLDADAGKARKAKQKAIQIYRALADELKTLQTHAVEFQGMQDWFAELLGLIIEASQQLDGDLNGGSWNPGIVPQYLSPDSQGSEQIWAQFLENAFSAGHITNKKSDSGVGSALKAANEKYLEWDSTLNHKKKRAANKACRLKIVALIKNVDAYYAAHKDAHPDFANVLAGLKVRAGQVCGRLTKEQSDIVFATLETFTPEAWESTYYNAVASGAVPESSSALKAIKAAMTNYLSEKDRLEKISDRDVSKKFIQAETTLGKLLMIHPAISKAQGMPDFGSNRRMEEYFVWLRNAVEDEQNSPLLQGPLKGTNVDFEVVSFQEPNSIKEMGKLDGQWQKVKGKAHTAGLINKKKKSHLRGSFKLLKSRMTSYKSALNKGDLDKIDEAATKAQEAINRLVSHADKLRTGTGNANFQAYFNVMIAWANQIPNNDFARYRDTST